VYFPFSIVNALSLQYMKTADLALKAMILGQLFHGTVADGETDGQINYMVAIAHCSVHRAVRSMLISYVLINHSFNQSIIYLLKKLLQFWTVYQNR